MREKAKARLICIIVAAVLAALLVPLAARAWLALKAISSNTNGDGMYRYPALAARGSNVYAMWSRQEGSSTSQTDPYYDKSSNDGLTWEPDDINIQPSASTETASLDLTIDSADRVHFVWAEVAGSSPLYTYTLYYSYTIATAIETIAQTTDMVTHPAVEVSSGDVHVVWAQDLASIMYHTGNIGTWPWPGSPTNIYSSSDPDNMIGHPDIAVDDSDDLHVVWEEWDSSSNETTILYKKRTGGVWATDPITLSTGIPNSRRPAIAVYSDTVNVVWCEFIDFGIQYVRFRQSTDGGSTWAPSSERISGTALAVNASISTYLWPAITVDSNGKIHVAFNGGNGMSAPEDIHYVSRPEGGSWSYRWNVTHNLKNATTPAIAAAGDWVHLIWAQQSAGTLYDVYYSRAGILEEVKPVYLPVILKAY